MKWTSFGLVLAGATILASAARPLSAQEGKDGGRPAANRLAGEWRGILRLDNSAPEVALVFTSADSTCRGTVSADGSEFGEMENCSVRGDTVRFDVGRFVFRGVLRGADLSMDIVVYNGSTRTAIFRKLTVPPRRPPESFNGEHAVGPSGPAAAGSRPEAPGSRHTH